MAKNDAAYRKQFNEARLRRGYRPIQEWLSPKQQERLDAMAKSEGRPRQQMFRRIVTQALGEPE
jgi:hypothetical protein